jgi:tetratricopeptide (TPR) repeat protein
MNYYRQAGALAPEPDLAHVKEKAHMWLGQDYLAGSYAELYKTGKSPNFQSAMDEFRQVILAYDRAPDEILAELAADAHARLGLIARLENHLQEGIDEYQKALDLVSDPVKKEQYQEALATLQATGP